MSESHHTESAIPHKIGTEDIVREFRNWQPAPSPPGSSETEQQWAQLAAYRAVGASQAVLEAIVDSARQADADSRALQAGIASYSAHGKPVEPVTAMLAHEATLAAQVSQDLLGQAYGAAARYLVTNEILPPKQVI